MDYQTISLDLATARPAGQGAPFYTAQRRLYALTVPSAFSVRLGSAQADAIPVAAAGLVCAEDGPLGNFYIENDAGSGSALLLVTSTLNLDFFGSSAASIAALVPGGITGMTDVYVVAGTHGSNTAPVNIGPGRVFTEQPYGLSAAGGTCQNFTDGARGLTGVQCIVNNAAGPGNSGLMPQGAPVTNRAYHAAVAALMTGTAAKPSFRPGVIYYESDIAYFDAAEPSPLVSRFALFGFGSLSSFQGFGLYYAPAAVGGSATNWILAGSQQGGAIDLFNVQDTGVAAITTTPRVLRIETGIMRAGGVGLIRALIDGVEVASIGSFPAMTANQANAIMSQNHAFVFQKDGANNNTFEALIMTGGIRRGWVEY